MAKAAGVITASIAAEHWQKLAKTEAE